MKFLLLYGLVLLGAGGLTQPLAAQSLDPGFAPSAIYSSGVTLSAVEQPDGKRLVVGGFTRVNGVAVRSLVRLTATGSIDAAFQQNARIGSEVDVVGLLSNGQILLTFIGNTPLVAGGLTRNSLLRLNADGTGDASFDPGTGPERGGQPGEVDYALPLPNGQLLVVGYFDHFNGTAANNIVRLTASGAVDNSFNPGTGADDGVSTVLLLPTGKLLIGGYFSDYNGSARYGLARLNADGSLDPTFNSGFSSNTYVYNLGVQPDGRILVGGYINLSSSVSSLMVRLLADGTTDSSFSSSLGLTNSFFGKAFELQPDGKIVLLTSATANTTGGVGRVNADGSLDPTFQAGTAPNVHPFSLTRLASGGVLVSGAFTDFNGVLDRPQIQLTSSGAVDASFQPLIQGPGTVSSLVRQPDGKLLAGGNFSEINGQTIRRLTRFNADGTLDGTFPINAFGAANVNGLALQADGRFLVSTSTSLRRYLTTASPDNSFSFNASTQVNGYISRILLQPDGRVLVSSANGSGLRGYLVRVLTDGAADASFTPSLNSGQFSFPQAMALQPNGKLLLAGTFRPSAGGNSYRTVIRLETSGAQDASFASTSLTTGAINLGVNEMAVQPDGKILVGGQFTAVGSSARAGIARLNADGTHDTGFTPPLLTGSVYKVLLQPNSRILLGGSFSGSGLPNNLARLLGTGQPDASYAGTAVPSSTVRALLVQPDGKLVVGGFFATIGGQPYMSLARITASNVLIVRAPQAVADRTDAWPVPAHTSLTVQPDASAHAQSLELLDVLGRAVRQQAMTNAGPTVLKVETMPAGTYLLRVNYAEGAVLRRIQVQ